MSWTTNRDDRNDDSDNDATGNIRTLCVHCVDVISSIEFSSHRRWRRERECVSDFWRCESAKLNDSHLTTCNPFRFTTLSTGSVGSFCCENWCTPYMYSFIVRVFICAEFSAAKTVDQWQVTTKTHTHTEHSAHCILDQTNSTSHKFVESFSATGNPHAHMQSVVECKY